MYNAHHSEQVYPHFKNLLTHAGISREVAENMYISGNLKSSQVLFPIAIWECKPF